MLPMDLLERDILKALSSMGITGGLRKWTKAIKTSIGKLGKNKYRCEVCTPGNFDRLRFRRGWLFDLVWLKENRLGIDRLPMILESEWGDYEKVKYDFKKLIVAKAEHRVMVFQPWTSAVSDDIAALERILRKSGLNSPGDRYLLVAIDVDGVCHERLYVHGRKGGS